MTRKEQGHPVHKQHAAILMLIAAASAPSVARSSQIAIDACMDYVMQICGPDAEQGMSVVSARPLPYWRGANITIRNGAGAAWHCRSLPDDSVGEVTLLEEPERRHVRLSPDDPNAVLSHALDPLGSVHFILDAVAGSVVFARVVQAAPDVSYELRGPDGAALSALQVQVGTDSAFLGRVYKPGDYVVRVVNDGPDRSNLLAVMAVH